MVSRAVWPVAGYGDEDGVACRIARRRIACGIARRLMASRPVPARVGDQCVPAMPTVRMPGGHTPMSPSAEPRLARTDLPSSVSECGKTGDPHRPCRTVTTAHRSPPGIVRASSGQNGTSWGRCTTGPPGRMREATRHKTRKNARGHHRTSPDIIRHHRVREGRRVPYGPSRGTATGMGRRVRYRPSPDRVPSGPSRAVGLVAGSRAVGPVARSRLITALSDSATSVSLPCPRSGIPKARHLLSPGPTYACSRRRQPLCANVYSFLCRGAL